MAAIPKNVRVKTLISKPDEKSLFWSTLIFVNVLDRQKGTVHKLRNLIIGVVQKQIGCIFLPVFGSCE